MNESKIEDIDWKDPPTYIKTPRKWYNGGFPLIKEKYIGVSSIPFHMYCYKDGGTFWVASDNIDYLTRLDIELIYKRIGPLRYERFNPDENAMIPAMVCGDCNGRGTYIGFSIVEDCKKCYGRGYL